ncbi:MAG: FAD-dependent oxidoreductase [Anaerolineae bacterium]
MRIGIIGGGLMGVALAYFLAKEGETVTVLEKGTELGGLNSEIQLEGDLSIPRYQHALLPTDDALRDLCNKLGLQDDLIFQKARAGFVHEGKIHPLSNIFDFLSFPVLSLWDRVRLGRIILQTRTQNSWKALDAVPAKEWLVRSGGAEAFDRIWRPLLEAKFDWVYENVSATYIWAWLNRMSSIRRGPQLEGSVGYLRRGHYSLIKALADGFRAAGGTIEYEARVREIEIDGGSARRVRTPSGMMEFDALIAAIDTPNFARLIPGADRNYLDQLAKMKYLGLICPVMVLDKPLTPYWTLNLTDPSFPFATIIEVPHPVKPELHTVYLPRYTAPDNDWMGVSDNDIRDAWISHLKMIFPEFHEESIQHFTVSRSRYVEPVHTVNTLQNFLEVATPYEGLFLANSGQVYPQLATSNAVIAHAGHVAQIVRDRKTVPDNIN